jgi:PiT family inorganic phosphate transporter
MGSITKVTSFEGVAAETAGALTYIFHWTFKNSGESTTYYNWIYHWVGLTKRVSACDGGYSEPFMGLGVLIPISALLAGLVYYFLSLFYKSIIVFE